jgi:hypothetical protein
MDVKERPKSAWGVLLILKRKDCHPKIAWQR